MYEPGASDIETSKYESQTSVYDQVYEPRRRHAAAAPPPPDVNLQEVELEVGQEIATTHQPPACTGIALKCHNCNFTTPTLRPSKAKQRLASHVHGGNCTTDTGEEYVNKVPHGDGMPSSMVSHQVLSHEDPREECVNEVSNGGGMQSPMVA